MKDKDGKQHCYHFIGSYLEVEIFLKKREGQKRSALKYKTEASLYTLYWGFQENSIIQNGTKFIQKITPGFKNYMRNLGNFR